MSINDLMQKLERLKMAASNVYPVIAQAVRETYANIKTRYGQEFKHPTGKTENAIRYAIEEREGRIWIAEERAYIARFHETGTKKMQPGKWIFKDERDRLRKEIPGLCIKFIMAGWKNG